MSIETLLKLDAARDAPLCRGAFVPLHSEARDNNQDV